MTSINLMWLFIRKPYAARLSHSMFCGCHADHNCHNKHSVAGVAHVEQEVAADGYDLQDGLDEDDDDKIRVMN